MPPEVIPDDDNYASSEDSDFAPEALPAHAIDNSSGEESDGEESTDKEAKTRKPKPGKRKRGQDEEIEDAGFENSGDEAIIERGLKRQRKKKGTSAENEDEGGEGGLVKTRSMRAQEKVERKPLANTSAATIDVDAVWASMMSGNKTAAGAVTQQAGSKNSSSPDQQEYRQIQHAIQERKSPSTSLGGGADNMIMIKQTYNFAGKVHLVEKLVSESSAEAKLFLSSQATTEHRKENSSALFLKPKRPTKKVHRSVFEPVSELPTRTDLHFGSRKESDVVIVDQAGKDTKKLNTVEKSAVDWAGFVDKEGIKDELDAAGKSKGAYRARQEFLARVEQKKEGDARRARGLPL